MSDSDLSDDELRNRMGASGHEPSGHEPRGPAPESDEEDDEEEQGIEQLFFPTPSYVQSFSYFHYGLIFGMELRAYLGGRRVRVFGVR